MQSRVQRWLGMDKWPLKLAQVVFKIWIEQPLPGEFGGASMN